LATCHNFEDSVFKQKYGFMYASQRSNSLWWWQTLIVTARKLLISACISLLPRDSSFIPTSIVLVLFFSLMLQMSYRPYRRAMDNYLESFLLTMALLTFLASVILGDASTQIRWTGSRSTVILVLRVGNFAAGLICFFCLFENYGRRWVRRVRARFCPYDEPDQDLKAVNRAGAETPRSFFGIPGSLPVPIQSGIHRTSSAGSVGRGLLSSSLPIAVPRPHRQRSVDGGRRSKPASGRSRGTVAPGSLPSAHHYAGTGSSPGAY